MGRGKVKAYDEEALVEMLGDANKTYAEIARRLGLNQRYVAKVARGERRREVYRRLLNVRRARIEEARRYGARWARALLRRHIKAGLSGNSEMARKCREFMLRQCCFGPHATSSPPPPLTPVAGEALAALLGDADAGARDDDADPRDAREGSADLKCPASLDSPPIREADGEGAEADGSA